MSRTLIKTESTELPDGYRVEQPPPAPPLDRELLDALAAGTVEVAFRSGAPAQPGELRMVIYSGQAEISLDDVVPILHSLGLGVVDEHATALRRADGLLCRVYDFGVRPTLWSDAGSVPALDVDRLLGAFRAGWSGAMELDTFNALILGIGLDWQQCAMLRGYAAYLQQAAFPHSPQRMAAVLLGHPEAARALVSFFEAKFDPDVVWGTSHDETPDPTPVVAEIGKVLGLDADRILRAYLSVIESTLRTNMFSRTDVHRPLAWKIAAEQVAELPEPRPLFETFVHSPRVAGTHLRFGLVARGGLRWSDRLDDFRTEVLGLVKAQAVKNSVIVPVGAKGVFVVRKPPQPAGDSRLDRENLRAEGVDCYREFVSALIDLTDNQNPVTGQIEPPERVLRYDGDDSYLVVAADKGTAQFSDIANAVARERGFWLGDAFASGGSVGYDHKKMGITARGAWESVRQHLREAGIDDQRDQFTVVGVGDMSGDVFGNGMLMSESLRLIAAFDHRHIFIDPAPDPTRSFRERQRLFTLPQSSWADYDRTVIGPGGGVWSREDKSIALSVAARKSLGISESVTSMTPPELIRAILRAPVDLLWNGGIGTYVKAGIETNLDVGDKANDGVRVDAAQIRARVVGEGGNLGFTQRGRIEFARAGGAINTDALDNSAGVSCSDHEVNIKIVLDGVVRSGILTPEQRARMLGEMTEEVATLVLADNVAQNRLIGEARHTSALFTGSYGRLITLLESRHGLNTALEALPSESELAARADAGEGLTSPELATLAAHTKLALKSELLESDLLDRRSPFDDHLRAYFPAALVARFPQAVADHPLRREIIATQLINEMVDRGGITYVLRLSEETGADITDVVRTYCATSSIFGFDALWRQIDGAAYPAAVAFDLTAETRRLLDRASRWLLTNRPQQLAIGAEVARFRGLITQLSKPVGAWLRGSEQRSVQQAAEHWAARGVEPAFARDISELLFRYCLLDIIEASDVAQLDPFEFAVVYFALSDHLQIDKLLVAVSSLSRKQRWNALARLALRDELYRSLRTITQDVCRSTLAFEHCGEKIAQWEGMNAARLSRSRATLRQIDEEDAYTLATLSVASREIRTMAQAG
ncbi:NAD-glutamate dehydrogenase domain-containing protein [Nocardia tengchongensis]